MGSFSEVDLVRDINKGRISKLEVRVKDLESRLRSSQLSFIAMHLLIILWLLRGI